MENINDLKQYLNLQEGEEILFINRHYGESLIPINNLSIYHEPEKFPKQLITKRKKNYAYHPIDIITNFRIILFRLNSNYIKQDQITPVSEVFHFDNFILWINNEDILDYKIKFADFYLKETQFIFYHKDGIKALKSPIIIGCHKYENYLRVKELSINLFKFKKEVINLKEQREIDSIINSNKIYIGAT